MICLCIVCSCPGTPCVWLQSAARTWRWSLWKNFGGSPSGPLPFSFDGTQPHALDLQRCCHRHLCVWRLHCPAVHFFLRIVTYPQYVANLFADNKFTKSAVAAEAILIARSLYLNLGWAGL